MLRTGLWKGDCDEASAAAMDCPLPRVELGRFLSHYATACADISDGFLKDLGNILTRSQVGAVVHVDDLAVSDSLAKRSVEERRMAQLAGGDDYELVWTAPVAARDDILDFARSLQTQGRALKLSRVGEVVPSGLKLFDKNGSEVKNSFKGFDHFASENV